MKYLVTLIALFFATPINAQRDTHELCTAAGMIAESSLEGRFNRIPLSTAIKALYDTIEVRKETLEYFKSIVMAAYSWPINENRTARAHTVAEFRNFVERRCYRIAEEEGAEFP